jgi:hypothetical protein
LVEFKPPERYNVFRKAEFHLRVITMRPMIAEKGFFILSVDTEKGHFLGRAGGPHKTTVFLGWK